MSAKQLWSFEAVDTLFFKESRPIEAVGGAQLQSVFPPPARTLVGAIRTAIGEAVGVDWRAYGTDARHPLRALMGDAQHLGPLSFQGPVLERDGQRLFPVPLAVLAAQGPRGMTFTRLRPSDTPVDCDIGRVRLPVKATALDGAKPMEGKWMTQQGLERFLRGEAPRAQDLIAVAELLSHEDRLGIGRNVQTGSVVEGLLYQTRHIRPRPGVRVGMSVSGLVLPELPMAGLAKLGAEGRMAHWQRADAAAVPAAKGALTRALVVLLTHARFGRGWLPDGLAAVTQPDGSTAWEGKMQGVDVRLLCAVTGKPVREGGWDLASHAPRAMDSLVPAGSCYFLECLEPGVDAQRLVKGAWGLDTQWGRGEIAVGAW